ncbi:putative TonB family protein [Candidatus Sulfotelmatomonas gaucii]|uniref:Putative TonB family protein n=1 Tax=Candidatus Sulfuritelmatomonas gaucii TaxID=2043161 RepID=A0A2N9L950_9BACT|nr:putative TonB family protein [Candidatus Sulfotelmatomonas gaucii]
MPMTYSPGQINLGLLPEPEGRSVSFITSSLVNVSILGVLLYVGVTAKQVIQRHYEMTELIVPNNPPPPEKVKQPPPPKLPPPPEQPKLEIRLQPKQIELPKPKPEPKPVQLEAKLTVPKMEQARPQIVLAPQPKAVLGAAMPAQDASVKLSTAPVHLGQTFGVTPNPNATRPATVAAIGNPYGGMQGPAVAPHGLVGSTGFGNGRNFGSSAGIAGKVASAGIPGQNGNGNKENYGKVASAGIPAMTPVAAPKIVAEQVQSTEVEVLSKTAPQYTAEARQMRVEGDVVLSVTFLASGHVVVHNVIRGLGHGLDEEARRVAEQIRFRPATSNGHPVDFTTKITITFQLA